MRIKINEAISKIDNNRNLIIDVSVSIKFINEKCFEVKKINLLYGDKKISFDKIFDIKKKELRIKHIIDDEEEDDEKKVYKYIIRFVVDKDEHKLDDIISDIYILRFINRGHNVDYRINIYNNGKIEVHKDNKHAWLPIVLCMLTVFIAIYFNLNNEDVFNAKYTLPSIIGVFIAFIISFFGLSLTSLFKLFLKMKKTIFSIFKYPEMVVKPFFLNFYKKKYGKIIVSISFILVIAFFYYYTPFKLPNTDKYSYYYNNSIILNKKVYRKDIDSVYFTLNENSENNRIYLGRLQASILKVSYIYNKFYFSKQCNNPIKDSVKVVDVVSNRPTFIDTIIYNTIIGNEKIKWKRISNTVYNFYIDDSYCTIDQFLNDLFENDKELINRLWKIDKSSDLYPLAEILEDIYEKNIKPKYNDYINSKLFKDVIKTDEINFIYNNLVHSKNYNINIEPFFTAAPVETFTRLVKLYSIFKCTNEDITINTIDYDLIGKDFNLYIMQDNYNRFKNRYIGFGVKDLRVLRMYAILLSYLQSSKFRPEPLTLFSPFIINTINQSVKYNNKLPIYKRNVEYSSRMVFLRCLFEEYIRFNIPLNEDVKLIFKDNIKSLVVDKDIINIINNKYSISNKDEMRLLQSYMFYLNM